MNPYGQNYYSPYPQYQQPNPYMQRMENLQQFQQVVNQPVIPMQNQQMLVVGKMVESEDIVRVTDIPMDGNIYYFPKADGTEIYSKQFMPNGQTRILTFKPVLNDCANISSNEQEKSLYEGFNSVLVGIQEDVKALNEKIDKISKPIRSKKEVSEDE